ncbi:DUF2778 domain-containing protein [Erwinia amylovora]|nr:DUF2778 domain-containing protein [Erwinia amylovora]UDJ86336.1 DUF2778 domain-containing protein [Erwinia amylovora]UDJ97796.1 DUF2778 domain-containing protein [Erwinia amylovora]UDK90144.1 DUF2778 domain-containing protein [Erwinia amylovora]UDK93536.1 DUF2778 domain-containing protein [Erwinia amylovora]UOD74371.1 DUF2778 domain-containing protein [Erwinia amylovora]
MIQMSMIYDDDARRSGRAVLTVYGIGTFSVLSGREKFINNVNCSYVTDYGSIPVGDYWIVKMPSSGLANTILREIKDMVNHTNHDEWFGLFSAQTVSDSVFVNGVKRGQFRLHPLRPDGSGESWGCITFFKVSDFQQVRRALLRTQQVRVPGSRAGMMAYGKVSVKGKPDYAKCDV